MLDSFYTYQENRMQEFAGEINKMSAGKYIHFFTIYFEKA